MREEKGGKNWPAMRVKGVKQALKLHRKKWFGFLSGRGTGNREDDERGGVKIGSQIKQEQNTGEVKR